MATHILTDSVSNLYVKHFSLASMDLDASEQATWEIEKVRLKGGRRDRVDLIAVSNGRLTFQVIPTRGMNLWKGNLGSIPLGWNSPVKDGPIHPSLVDAQAWGGLGWLDGFDELLARCGMDSFGPPFENGGRTYTLHGRVSNIPAHYVAVHVDDHAPHAITIEGRVLESRLFHTQIELTTKITTVPGSNTITVRDEFRNVRDSPSDLQILYHWNFGPPLMEEGAKFVAPIKTIVPRDKAAVEGLGHYNTYGPPSPGSAEMVYFFELLASGPEGRTLALLRNRKGDAGVALRFSTAQLPGFTLWKNQGGLNEGYVTGLEPGSNYPNPKPFEASRKRVRSLAPGEVHVAETVLEVADTAEAVASLEAEIAAIQGRISPTIHPKPVEPFVSEG